MLLPLLLVCQRTVPSSPTEPIFSVDCVAMVNVDLFTLSVFPCAAAMVEVFDKKRAFVRVSFAVASSSPPPCVRAPDERHGAVVVDRKRAAIDDAPLLIVPPPPSWKIMPDSIVVVPV